MLSVAIQGKLFHPNCKHTSSTYFPEVDEDYVVIKGDETAEYSTIQRQNEINRNIQKYERLKTGSLDSQNIKKYGDKVNELQERKFEILEGQQEYKPVKIDTTKSFSRNRRNRVINAYKLVGIKNDIYLSKKAKLKPKQLNNIDNSITKAYELIENRDGYIKPIIVITEYAELDGAMASYSAINNVMYINSELGTISKLLDIQKGLACPENKLSTYYHEFLHWKDAQDYISKKGAINNQRDYLKWCVIQSKKKL